ncbi:YbaB/EbfC family nucleoid-associated protein [Mycobacterium sp. pUA109]|uniref:YbaB/EbfC family nucleoid-associated protein n=1 Tax=Mycobacterium sp. pUA109 TaxID=3238982 RepID=UPI00351B9D4C
MTSLAQSLMARMRKQRDLMQALGEHCKSISVRVTSRDQSVSAEVTASGEMTGLWLGPSATRLGADALAKLIVETAQAASRLALERQNFLIKEFNSRMAELQETPLTCWDGSTFVPNQLPGIPVPEQDPPIGKNPASTGPRRRL